MKPSSRLLYVKVVTRFASYVKKPISGLTEEDLKMYVATLENKYTQRHTCATLKKFLAFVDRKDLAELLSVPVINLSQRIDEIDRITSEEVKKLLMVEDNARNQALIALLYESAGRLGEVLGIKISDVHTDEYGIIVKLFGKTKLRNVRLVASAPYVTRWLQLHAYRDIQSAPLFYSVYHGKMKVLGRTMFSKIIRKAAEKAGFKGQQLKKFHPHAFRHGRLSELGHDLTDSEMKHVGGWTDRRMISLYSHVDEDRVNNKLLMLQGITVEEQKKVSELELKPCPRCKNLNGTTALYCERCGIPLTPGGIKKLETKDGEIQVLKEQVSELREQNQELKQRLNGTTLTSDQVAELLRRIELLEKQAQK